MLFFRIVIVTHDRVEICASHTLAMLRDNHVPPELITILVHNEEQKQNYENGIPSNLYNDIIVSNTNDGVYGQMNYITDHYDEGTKIIKLDDDISYVYDLVDNVNLVKSSNLLNIIDEGYRLCDQHGAKLWGLYPCANPYFVCKQKEYSTDLRFVVGAFMGIIIDKKNKIDLNIKIKGDYALAVESFINNGSVIRLNRVCFKYHINKNVGLRTDVMVSDARILVEKYPAYVRHNLRRNLKGVDMGEILLIRKPRIVTQKKQYYTINEPDKLLEFINGELKPKEKEKRENGEVFTPLYLVNEMLDKLDEAYIKEHEKSIFTEDKFKWLDPAVGIGNFQIIVYQRLMKGLITKIPNEEERRKHILEEMLYMVEISDKSIYILGKIFCGDKYKLNIHNGSFLNSKCRYDFMFDVVMGNPPYNPPKTKTGSSGNSLWQQFVIKSFYLVKEIGFLLFIQPSGWKKPTDKIFDSAKLDIITTGEYYKYDKKTGKQTIKQIRQGQVWQVLRDNGMFSFIYTNDQKNKKIKEYIPYFPAVDYYVYQKNGVQTTCNTKNIFLGETTEATVKLNYELNYLPNLITNQTQHILHNVTRKEGKKPNFNTGIDERQINWTGKTIDWVYDANKKGFQYKKHGINASSVNGKTKKDTVGINKIILNFGGGISSYNVKYISTSEEIGVLDKTMYSMVETELEGKCMERFLSSDIVKFIFLITQYVAGAITQNEHLVANSITIPPEDVDDYYVFFDIEKDKKYIEDILTRSKI